MFTSTTGPEVCPESSCIDGTQSVLLTAPPPRPPPTHIVLPFNLRQHLGRTNDIGVSFYQSGKQAQRVTSLMTNDAGAEPRRF